MEWALAKMAADNYKTCDCLALNKFPNIIELAYNLFSRPISLAITTCHSLTCSPSSLHIT